MAFSVYIIALALPDIAAAMRAEHVYIGLWAAVCVYTLACVITARPVRPVGRHERPPRSNPDPQTYVGAGPPPDARPGDTYVSMTSGIKYRRTRFGQWRPVARP